MTTKISLLFGMLFVSTSFAAAADGNAFDNNYFEDLPVVLTASRLQQSAGDAPAAVTVIDRAMIVASGARRLEDVLRLVPGFYVGYSNGNTPVVGYHGFADAYARRMQVLVDGVSIYSPLYGGVEWSELPLTLQDIERIEVVRGPNAVTYGANAYLCVINIITRDPATEPRFQMGLNSGGDGVRDLVVRTAGQGDDLRYRISYARRNDDGFNTMPDSSRVDLLNLRSNYRVNQNDDLSFQVRASRSTLLEGRTSADLLDTERPRNSSQNTMQVRWTRSLSADDEIWVQAYHHDRFVREDISGVLPFPGRAGFPIAFNKNYDVKRDDIEFQQLRKLSDQSLRVAWGGQWRQDSGKSMTYFNREEWLTNHLSRLFANLEWRPMNELAIHGGAMLERNSMNGSSILPRLAATYAVSPGHNLRIGVSRANRAPTIGEERVDNRLYAPPGSLPIPAGLPLTIAALGTGNLSDEKILSREIAYVGEMPELKLGWDLRCYSDQLSKLIVMTRTHPVITFYNLMAYNFVNSPLPARENGLELSGHWSPWLGTKIHVTATSLRIDSAIPDTAQSAPSHTRSLLVSQALPKDLSFSVGYYAVGEMKWQASDIPTTVLPAYNTLDLRLSKLYRLGHQQVELAVMSRNVLGSYKDFYPGSIEQRISFLQLNMTY